MDLESLETGLSEAIEGHDSNSNCVSTKCEVGKVVWGLRQERRILFHNQHTDGGTAEC